MTLHLAQLNVARMAYEQDDPRLDGFMNALDEINGLGERSQGFVWRYQDESGAAVDTHAFDDPRVLLNYTIWESVEDLRAFTYQGGHLEYFRRRLEWFEPHSDVSHVMWWVPAGTIPPIPEAQVRLEHLREHGPTSAAFGFADAKRFEPEWVEL